MIYIIILTWNGSKYLSKLFNSLQNLNYDQKKIKYIIIDSGSTDGTIKFLENLNWPNLQFVKLEKNIGFTSGNNIGLRSALENNAAYVVLLNQDTYVEPDFLIELIKTAESEKNIGIVQSLILYYDQPKEIASTGNQLNYLGFGWCALNHHPLASYQLPVTSYPNIVFASGAAVLYKGELLNKIGIFDENYFSYYEDTDICLRAQLQHYQTVLAPHAICYHDNRNPVSKNKIRYFWLERNRLYLLLKFYSLKTLILILPTFLGLELFKLIISLKKHYFWQFLKARLWFIFNFKKWFLARGEIQRNRKVGDRELTKDFVSEIIYQDTKNSLLNKIGNPIIKFYWQIIKQFI